jgi:hypothetical protein
MFPINKIQTIATLKLKKMNEFLLIFRRDYATKEVQPSPEELQQHLKQWQEWFGSLAAQDKLARPLQRWDGQGKIVTNTKSITNGPYAEIKESIGGLIIVKVKDYDEAVHIAKDCPIIQLGGNVEIRMAI